MRPLPPLVLLALLAGCGSVTLTDEDIAYQDALAEANALAQSVDRSSPINVLDGNLPTGTAFFQGFVEVAVDTPTQTSLLGDATLVANFNTRRVEGALENFVGSVNGGPNRDFGADVINLIGGTIPDRPDGQVANWGANIVGDLSSGTDRVVVAGSVGGGFRGETSTGGPVAIQGESASGTIFTVTTPTLTETYRNNDSTTQVQIVGVLQ